MGELTTKKQTLPKKEAIGQYVHDMLDLEIRAHSLRKMAKTCTQDAVYKAIPFSKEQERAASAKDAAGEELNRAKAAAHYKESESFIDWYFDGFRKVFGFICFIISLFAAFVCVILLFDLFSYGASYYNVPIVCGILYSIIYALVYFIHFVRQFGDWQCERSSVQKRLENAEAAYAKAEKDFVIAEKNWKKESEHLDQLFAYSKKLEQEADRLHTNLQAIYALNIVPPDYRRLECLLWIDYAFRNDQVDTMRQATLQCDKWTRHGEQMQVLNELARNFRSIGELLKTMNTNISMMNQDLFRIAEAQEKQLSETQSARYAMESVKQSTERLEFYEKMKRHGMF